ncbi:MAG: BolA family transcriptional regulator [Gammaproteobacteria bacterium]|nr:MAG: BolA family transcriptional regulator [Gammaproteobacteria bacterium]
MMMTPEKRLETIKELLIKEFKPIDFKIEDNSAAHQGHSQNSNSAGHYTIYIKSAKFTDKPIIEQHKMIYATLNALLKEEIHAISINTSAP